MNVVVYDPTKAEGIRIFHLLRDRGVGIVVTHEAPRLLSLVQQRTDLVLLCADPISPELYGLIDRLREHPVIEPGQIQLVSRGLTDLETALAFEAGIDAVVPWGSGRDALWARLGAVTRVLDRVERRPGATPFRLSTGAEQALRGVARSNAWRAAPVKLRQVLEPFFGVAAVPVPNTPDPAPPLERAAAIGLVSAAQGVEIRIGVGADAGSALALAGRVFGPDAAELVGDMLGEVANMLMGALKTQLHGEGLPFTGGLPALLPVQDLALPPIALAYRDAFAVNVAGSRLTIDLGMHAQVPSTVGVPDLREGMVIANDILSDRGVLLLKGGTRLSQMMIEKLAKMLPPRTSVQVVGA